MERAISGTFRVAARVHTGSADGQSAIVFCFFLSLAADRRGAADNRRTTVQQATPTTSSNPVVLAVFASIFARTHTPVEENISTGKRMILFVLFFVLVIPVRGGRIEERV